jgi:hypothetical protein
MIEHGVTMYFPGYVLEYESATEKHRLAKVVADHERIGWVYILPYGSDRVFPMPDEGVRPAGDNALAQLVLTPMDELTIGERDAGRHCSRCMTRVRRKAALDRWVDPTISDAALRRRYGCG